MAIDVNENKSLFINGKDSETNRYGKVMSRFLRFALRLEFALIAALTVLVLVAGVYGLLT